MWPVYPSSDITATDNFWNTTDTSVIDSMIYDKNDDLGCANYITYIPFLNSPHPDTPVFLFELNVVKSGIGSGKVTSSPEGIDCGSDCSETFDPDSAVILTAIPDKGSIFTGWSGSGCSGNGTCTVNMDEDKELIANFSTCIYTILPTNQFFSSSTGAGTISVATSSGCSWTATSNDSWITVISGSSGIGNGTVNYSVSANTSTSQRTGIITIVGQTFTILQEGVQQTKCSNWTDVISKYNAYVGGSASWTDVIACYNQYTS